jgi:hypothetical protein
MKQFKNNVLIISPTPTHPVCAGNRQHICSIIDDLRSLDCKVFFFYINRESFHYQEMNTFLDNELEIFNERVERNIFSKIKRKIALATFCLFDFSKQRKFRKKFNQPLDLDFPKEIIPRILATINNKNINIVIVEYIVISKVLSYLPKKIIKIIDTHDKFTDRYKIYLEQGLQPSWTSLNRKDEIKGLNRADSIICLNYEELDFYKKNGLQSSYYIYSNLSLKKDLSQAGSSLNLLYLASANDINKQSINDFLANHFFSLIDIFPKLQLVIAGEISKHINLKHENIVLLGFVNDLESFYSQGKIVINPEKNGTGQKIKSIEALRYNKILVSTTNIGLEDSEKLYFKCQDYFEMVSVISSIILNESNINQKYLELENIRINQRGGLKKILV